MSLPVALQTAGLILLVAAAALLFGPGWALGVAGLAALVVGIVLEREKN